MALDLAKIVGNAVKAAQRVGVTASITFTRPPSVNPLTGVAIGSAVSQVVADAIIIKGRRVSAASDDDWSEASLVVFVAATSLLYPIKRGDTATGAGGVYKVTKIKAEDANGTPYAYTVYMGVEA